MANMCVIKCDQKMFRDVLLLCRMHCKVFDDCKYMNKKWNHGVTVWNSGQGRSLLICFASEFQEKSFFECNFNQIPLPIILNDA
jgi:hypothetical protein